MLKQKLCAKCDRSICILLILDKSNKKYYTASVRFSMKRIMKELGIMQKLKYSPKATPREKSKKRKK